MFLGMKGHKSMFEGRGGLTTYPKEYRPYLFRFVKFKPICKM